MTKLQIVSMVSAFAIPAFMLSGVAPASCIHGLRNSIGENQSQPSAPFTTVATTSARKLIGNDCIAASLRVDDGMIVLRTRRCDGTHHREPHPRCHGVSARRVVRPPSPPAVAAA